VVKKFFKTIDVSEPLTRLTGALQEILSSDPEIRDVVWTKLELKPASSEIRRQ
jgi:hypothetical protein